MIIQVLAWCAIAILASSHWLQVWKIHQHREVRDIAIGTYWLLLLGYSLLTVAAWNEGSLIFFVRQIATFVPVTIVIFQVNYHNRDHWHDDNDPICLCGEELELEWSHCPYCGVARF